MDRSESIDPLGKFQLPFNAVLATLMHLNYTPAGSLHTLEYLRHWAGTQHTRHIL